MRPCAVGADRGPDRRGPARCPGARRTPAAGAPRASARARSPALRLPVTGSSGTAKPGAERAHLVVGAESRAASSGSCGPITPSSRPRIAAKSGRSASTSAALVSSRPSQPGPLSIHAARTHLPGSTPSADSARPRVSSSTVAGAQQVGGAGRPGASVVRAGSSTSPSPHSCTTRSVRRGHPARLQPGVGAAQRRVPGERQLLGRGEDPQPVVGARRRGRQQERGLREVGPAREGGHLRRRRGRSASCTTATGLPASGPAAEHVDLGEGVGRHARQPCHRSRPVAAAPRARPPAARRPDHHGHVAVPVGARDPHPASAQQRHQRRRRVAVVVVRPHRDHRQPGARWPGRGRGPAGRCRGGRP